MKKTLTLAILGVSTGLAACGELVEIDGVRLRCGDKSATVTSNPAHLQVNPESVAVCRGYSLTLRFRGPTAVGSARTRPAGGGNPWLEVENTSTDRIVIEVPGDAATGERKYTLEVDGIGLLDPRIVVQ
jgi:hypothetical protein